MVGRPPPAAAAGDAFRHDFRDTIRRRRRPEPGASCCRRSRYALLFRQRPSGIGQLDALFLSHGPPSFLTIPLTSEKASPAYFAARSTCARWSKGNARPAQCASKMTLILISSVARHALAYDRLAVGPLLLPRTRLRGARYTRTLFSRARGPAHACQRLQTACLRRR